MLKKLIIITGFIIFNASFGLAQAKCTYNSGNAIAATWASIVNAYATAVDGDVVCVQAGTVHATSQINTSNGNTIAIELRGAGPINATCLQHDNATVSARGLKSCGSAGQTIISQEFGGPSFNIQAHGTHPQVIDNFQFVYDAQYYTGLPYGVAIINSTGDGSVASVLHHNDYIMTNTMSLGSCGQPFIYFNQNRGVISGSRFIHNLSDCPVGNPENIFLSRSDPSNFETASTWGSGDTGGTNNIYVESNYFFNFRVANDAPGGDSIRAVWRFNEMHNSSENLHGFDSGAGVRQWEVYGNTYYCDAGGGLVVQWSGPRGSGSYRYFNQTYPAYVSANCGPSPSAASIDLRIFPTFTCDGTAGWPGDYSDTIAAGSTRPMSHQSGWGWNSLDPTYVTGIGSSSFQNLPGKNSLDAGYATDGYRMSLEPTYLFNNSNSTGKLIGGPYYVAGGSPGNCRAMAYSFATKASGTTIAIQASNNTARDGLPAPYATSGEAIIAVLADLVGGTIPTISSSPVAATLCSGGSWTSLATPVSNGSTRLSAFTCTAAVTGQFSVTFTHDSSTAARAATVAVMRGVQASPLDKHPAMTTISGTGSNPVTYTAPSSGTLATCPSTGVTACEIVLGYFALTDGITGYPWTLGVGYNIGGATGAANWPLAFSCAQCPGGNGSNGGLSIGINGTTTGSADVSVGLVYQVVNATTAVTPQITDTNNVTAVGGTVSFIANANTDGLLASGTPFDLQTDKFAKLDREIYDDVIAEGGTCTALGSLSSGVCSGPRSARPATCTTGSSNYGGVQWWAWDQGSWNNSPLTDPGGHLQGVLDSCTATNTWTNANYIPYAYPHTSLAPVITTEPMSQTIAGGSTATMSVAGYGSTTQSYQWYQGFAGNFATPVVGATSSSYTTPSLASNTNYWVDVINTGGHTNSTTAVITVTGSAPVIGNAGSGYNYFCNGLGFFFCRH